MMDCIEALVGMLLTHLARKSPIETSFDDELDGVAMNCVEATM